MYPCRAKAWLDSVKRSIGIESVTNIQLSTRNNLPGKASRWLQSTTALALSSTTAALPNGGDPPRRDHDGLGETSPDAKMPKTLDPLFFTSAFLGDLSNPIHPIFRPENFTDSSIHYATIENSLRLASRFITTSPLLPFWHAVLCGPVEESSRSHGPLSTLPNRLTQAEERQVTERLALLGDCVTFSSDRMWARGDGASTERLLADAPSPFRGVKSHIHLGQRLFARMEQSYLRPSADSLPRLWSHFAFASLLLHELTHASMLAAHPRPPASDPIQAYFVPGSRTTEEGLEWEALTFGGIMYEIPTLLLRRRNVGLFNMAIMLREWPSPRLVAKYTRSLYPRPFPVKGELPTHDKVWVVSHGHIERMFTTHFWDKVITSEEAARALQPVRGEGFIERGVWGLLTRDDQ